MRWKQNPIRRLCARIEFVAALAAMAALPTQAAVDFARDIQPILAQRCYDCHGAEKPKGGLQLTNLREALKGGESGEPALVAGASAKSALIQRVLTDDSEDVMPQKGDRLTSGQIDTLKRWIDEGAVWPENAKHWAYVKPVRPTVPAVTMPGAKLHNPIDNFILARLEKEGLRQAPETDKPRWLRRVSLDLVGLPPSPAELDAFLADDSPAAWERVVDRLLASPQYGVRWARPWLDLARYADSHGFQRDDLRDIWPYRDWVIRAMNADMPFDQFSIWQNAGDLLPGVKNAAGEMQNYDPLIATGFQRCAATNVEAGTDQEEGRVNQVFDRVNTAAAVWLGSTLECAQCHNHKFDPFTQKEYYQLFAFFNNSPKETDFATPKAKAALKFTGPYLRLPDPEKDERRGKIEAQVNAIEEKIAKTQEQLLPDIDAWETTMRRTVSAAGKTHVLEIADFDSAGESNYKILPDHSVLLVDDAPDVDTYTITVRTKLTGITGFKLEALTDPSLPGTGPGRGDEARPNFVLNTFSVTAAGADGAPTPVKFVRATASFSQQRFSVERLLQAGTDKTGWAINPQFRRDHWAVLETAEPIGFEGGTTLTFTLAQKLGGGRTIGHVRLSALTGTVAGRQVPADVAAIIALPKSERKPAQVTKLNDYYFAQDKTIAGMVAAKTKLSQEVAALKGPQTLVMRELAEPRQATVMNRGSFLDPGEAVQPGTPAVLPPLRNPEEGRLAFARWLVDRENPLVARVTVNRWWADFFGHGIVGTLEDFGIKGDAPTHPELLDWLAVEFMDHGWSMKHVHRLIALSATHRQSARITPDLLARDDQNLLYARGPRFRLDAETIRDNALAAAGLLSLKQGGPPVRPYQPPGIWENKVGGDRLTYEVSAGEDAWRRGIYTVWKRGSPYPSFVNFDATSRTACTIRRSRSNTPLQALTLLNDPVYVAAARALAKRVLTERPDASTEERIRYAFTLGLTRSPNAAELTALKELFEQQRMSGGTVAGQAEKKIGAIDMPGVPNVDEREFSAWQAVSTALLNLDEMITKG